MSCVEISSISPDHQSTFSSRRIDAVNAQSTTDPTKCDVDITFSPNIIKREIHGNRVTFTTIGTITLDKADDDDGALPEWARTISVLPRNSVEGGHKDGVQPSWHASSDGPFPYLPVKYRYYATLAALAVMFIFGFGAGSGLYYALSGCAL